MVSVITLQNHLMFFLNNMSESKKYEQYLLHLLYKVFYKESSKYFRRIVLFTLTRYAVVWAYIK